MSRDIQFLGINILAWRLGFGLNMGHKKVDEGN